MEFIKLFICGILGLIGYILSGLYDLAIIHEKKLLRKLSYPGFFITAIPYVILFFHYEIPHSVLFSAILLLLIGLFLVLLIYSVLIEIPRNSKDTSEVYDRGTYSFSRHPGFLWYTVLNMLMAVLFWNWGILLLCILFTVFNFALILIEDRILFPIMFSTYTEYRRNTPFLFGLTKIHQR